MLKDLIRLALFEKRTLLQGWIVCSLLVFPLTFLPVLVSDGFNILAIIRRIPLSILYSTSFSLIAVIVSIINNFNELSMKRDVFNYPAFTSLNFQGKMDGFGNIVEDIDMFIMGEIEEYRFIIKLENINLRKRTTDVIIIPFLDIYEDKSLVKRLIAEQGFYKDTVLKKKIKASQADLETDAFIRNHLIELCSYLRNNDMVRHDIKETV
ncbi:hypothetical protein [Dysgonomonas massiliensis]|uniref:hypothetical protein n=1 Tax=Dysgonomonas massiliensis TaxID=2040292 RepID=UPI000C793ABD|nr:hypothetical protein [Dysgonomonas massiliensis]